MKKIIKKILKSRVSQIIVSVIIYLYLWFVYITSKREFKFLNESDRLFYNNNNYILSFWHGRLAMMAFLKRITPRKINVLISNHSDGRIIAYVMRLFLFGILSGSSTQGWFSAYKQTKIAVSKKQIVAITPDGPRGPREKIGASNLVKLAEKLNLKIFPVVSAVKKKKIFNSWDKFIFPMPFNKIVLYIGSPIDPHQLQLSDEEKKQYVEDAMNNLSKDADDYIRY